MRRIYNLIAEIPIIGLLLEVCLLAIWLCAIRLQARERKPNLSIGLMSQSNSSKRQIYINCRNFLRPGHSGVNAWVESICEEIYNNYKITIFCQGINLFKIRTINVGNLTIKCLPIFKKLTLKKLPLHNAWMNTVQNEITKIEERTLLISPMNMVMAFGLADNKFVRQIVLLVTDERRHKYPNLTTSEIKYNLRINRKLEEIVRRENAILSNLQNRFIADSYAIIKDLEELYEVSIASRTQVQYINVPTDNCLEIEKEKIVLFIGRCDRRKGLKVLLEVFEKVKIDFPEWNFVVATSKGDDRPAFRRIKRISIRNKSLTLLLNASDEVKHKLLSRSSIVVLPSFYESFGITGLEAMQHRCAVLSSKVGGIPEVIKDGGILVSPGSIMEFSEALRMLMTNTQARMRLADLAEAQVSSLTSTSSMLTSISNIYDSRF
jgi:glycosyltransferase involved in cell wall biosynthesis